MVEADEITLKEFFQILEEVYEKDSDVLLQAESNPQMINYLVGKILQKSKGIINPMLAMDITNTIVKSGLVQIRKMEITV